jgi:hypothetical protein
LCAHHLLSAASLFEVSQFHAKPLPDSIPMTLQKLIVLATSLAGGAIGLFAPVGVVKWLLQTEPEDAGILTVFFFPVWCLLLVLGLLIGRRLGLLLTGGKRVLQR